MYVNMYVWCMYVSMYICVWDECMYVSMYVCIYVYKLCMHICM